MSGLDRRLAALILDGHEFSANELTECGRIALDVEHAANGRQSGIGGYFSQAASRGLIRSSGRVTCSCSPHRKGGAVRLWRGTRAGRAWAIEHHPGASLDD